VLAAAAAVLFANSQFCWFSRESCGMWEPIVAVYVLAIALPLIVAGLLHRRRKPLAAGLAYVPAALVVVILVGQSRGWW
jgi:hypothetical protein